MRGPVGTIPDAQLGAQVPGIHPAGAAAGVDDSAGGEARVGPRLGVQSEPRLGVRQVGVRQGSWLESGSGQDGVVRRVVRSQGGSVRAGRRGGASLGKPLS
jgi:hypothetical protein